METAVLYDAATGRPNSIAHSFGASTLASFGYGFDTDGKILSIADSGGARSFTYDATQQVTGGGYAGAPESYAYDPEGNRLTSHLSASYTHDTANRLREDIDTCYDYDANGNLTTKTVKVGGACTGDVTAYEWDVLNRLVRIVNPDATYAAYRYDAQGRRIEKDVNTSLTRYLYDDDAILLEYDGADTLLATYSHGEEVDQPLAMTRGAESFFYHTDHLGSIRLLTDGAGSIVNAYDYDAFGNLEPTSYETVANPYTFTAREYDAESGLMFYRARYYDPKIGRFISEDPVGFAASDLNLYRYVINRPQHIIDPSGMIIGYMGDLIKNGYARMLVIAPILMQAIPLIVREAIRRAHDAVLLALVGSSGAFLTAVSPGIDTPTQLCNAYGVGAGAAVGAAVGTLATRQNVIGVSLFAGLLSWITWASVYTECNLFFGWVQTEKNLDDWEKANGL